MTPEERIKAAAEALTRKPHETREAYAGRVLAAAYPEDFPPKPKWPSDESVEKFKAAYRSSTNSDIPMSDEWLRDCLREAMTPDPIIKAAVAHHRKAILTRHGDPDVVDRIYDSKRCLVCEAVNEAGL